MASAHVILAAWPGEWLLIFDNAPDEAAIRQFLPPAGRGQVLITSQSQHWPGATEPVPLGLLLTGPRTAEAELDADVAAVIGPLLGDQLAIADAVSALRRYSLVPAAGNKMVLTHRLVQAITRDQVPTEQAQAWQQATATLTEAATPADPDLPETWPACAALLPHVQAVLDLTSYGMRRIASYLGYSGSCAAAKDTSAKIAFALEHADGYWYGPRNRSPLKWMRCVGLSAHQTSVSQAICAR